MFIYIVSFFLLFIPLFLPVYQFYIVRIKTLYIIQSGDDDYLMNETRRKPATGRQPPSLFDKWHGIFYMLSHTVTAGHIYI